MWKWVLRIHYICLSTHRASAALVTALIFCPMVKRISVFKQELQSK